MAEGLTDKEELFCNEYLIDLNKTKSYMRAFGNENYASSAALASKLLKNVNVTARIRELMDARSKDTLVDAKYVVDSLVEIQERCMQAKPVLEWDYDLKEFKETGEYKFDSIGANKAAELLGKHVGMFNEKLKLDVEMGISADDIKAIASKLNNPDA